MCHPAASKRWDRHWSEGPETDTQHNKKGDLWVIIDSYVYDLSKFGAMHPGGLGVLLDAEVGASMTYCRTSSTRRRAHRLMWIIS